MIKYKSVNINLYSQGQISFQASSRCLDGVTIVLDKGCIPQIFQLVTMLQIGVLEQG